MLDACATHLHELTNCTNPPAVGAAGHRAVHRGPVRAGTAAPARPAAEQAGPALIIAWIALLGLSGILAATFAALGRAAPSAAGAAGYAAAGLGRRAAAVTRWWFLAGVTAGAPIVCLIGASYVTALTGGGPLARAAIAAGLLLAVLGLALGGVRASALAQLLLVALLIVVVVTAVAEHTRPAQGTGLRSPRTAGCPSAARPPP